MKMNFKYNRVKKSWVCGAFKDSRMFKGRPNVTAEVVGMGRRKVLARRDAQEQLNNLANSAK